MTVTANGSRRHELAQFLRTRRDRITPAEVGLPPGQRRRAPGLRREEVAQLAGVGVTWYTWLEQGRPINASVQILNAIARVLRLDRTEREHLYRLAEVPAAPEPVDCEHLTPEVHTILDSMVPLPAVVYNGRYDALAWNRTYQALFPTLINSRPGERNALLHMLLLPDCCCPVVNRETELPQMVAILRAAFGRHVGDPDWVAFVRRLSALSPVFAGMWAEHAVAGPHTRVKVFQHVGDRLLRTTSSSFSVGASTDLRMIVYTPLYDRDRGWLADITENPPPMFRCAAHPDGHALGQPAPVRGPAVPLS
jgi:transcriptional regulator with XRE-family HTH domain